jgi:predicted transcriptional regulator of viral defense system
MNQIEAIKRLYALRSPAFTTRDAAALLNVSPANSSMILRRLARHDFVTRIARGRWGISRGITRFALPELLSAPEPAYVSLQSALFHHGLIEQIPTVIYAITTGRTRRVQNTLATVSFHRVPPELFTGYDVNPRDGAKIATPEKALFDLLYLAPARSRLFARLPELEIPRSFRWAEVTKYVRLVKSTSRHSSLMRKIGELKSSWSRSKA